MSTVSKFFAKTAKRLRVFCHLDRWSTFTLRRNCKLEGWASVYVYPKNKVKVSKEAAIRITNGLMTLSRPWFESKVIAPCVFEMRNGSRLECNGNFDFVRGSKCFIKDGAILRLGKDSRMGNDSVIECNNEIVIGKNCWISDHVTITDAGKIVIEDGVWIGNGAKIEGSLRIGKNAVIGEGAIVTEDIESGLVFLKG